MRDANEARKDDGAISSACDRFGRCIHHFSESIRGRGIAQSPTGARRRAARLRKTESPTAAASLTGTALPSWRMHSVQEPTK